MVPYQNKRPDDVQYIGVMMALFNNMSLQESIPMLKNRFGGKVKGVEICVGAYSGMAKDFDPKAVLESEAKQQELLQLVADNGMYITALSCHGNPISPNQAEAEAHHGAYRITVPLAKKLGVDTVITFSGNPAAVVGDKYDGWVTCAWPPQHTAAAREQMVATIAYWKKQAAYARDHGINIAIEMHPGFVAHTTDKLLAIREAVGKNYGANFDPSHLWWQGMDPLVSLNALLEAGAVFHVHGKDMRANPEQMARNGALDARPYGDLRKRSWVFRTIGYGHGREFWAALVSDLATQLSGQEEAPYKKGVISIEHEDSLMTAPEGFGKAVRFLDDLVIREKPGPAHWF